MSEYTTTATLNATDENDETLHTCDHCGCEYTGKPVDVYTDHCIEEWCPDCADDDATECEHCGTLTANDNLETVGGESWCSECAESNAVWCDRCGELVDEDCAVSVNVWHNYRLTTETWCHSCAENHATECEDCGNVTASDSIECRWVHGDGYRDLCPDCLEENYYTCDECGELVSCDDVREHDGCYYCPDCGGSDVIESYGHTYASEFFNTDKERFPKLYLGVELETEYDDNDDRDAAATDVLAELGDNRVCCKEDGSLTDGFEIVTQPMTLRYLLDNDVMGMVARICKRHGGTSHDNGSCGLHVHLSRNAFMPEQITTIDRLIQTHRDEWTRFSRRTAGQLSQWAEIETDEIMGIKPGDAPAIKRDKCAKCKGYNRYKALNLNNRDTIELRLWRGSLNEETISATLTATYALAAIALTTPNPNAVESWTWPTLKSEIVRMLNASGLPCRDFVTYCERRGL